MNDKTVTPAMREDLWNAWVERGRKNNRASAKAMRIVGLTLAAVVVIAGAAFLTIGKSGL